MSFGIGSMLRIPSIVRTVTIRKNGIRSITNLSSLRSSITTSHFRSSSLISHMARLNLGASLSPVNAAPPVITLLSQVRGAKFGCEYNPSTLRRKRKFGFLARKKTHNGRRILARRTLKARKYLSH